MANMEMRIDSIHSSIRANEGRQILLQEKGKNRYLPIWIGVAEAYIIASKTRGLSMPRPLAHDFVCAVIDALGGSLESVVIHKLQDKTFHAKMIIRVKEDQKEIDCRPSDGMAMAVRKDVPILADEEVLNEAGMVLELPSESAEPLLEGMLDEQQTGKEE